MQDILAKSKLKFPLETLLSVREELAVYRKILTWLIILAAMGPWPCPKEMVWKWDLVTPNTRKEKNGDMFENIYTIDWKTWRKCYEIHCDVTKEGKK